jgi:5'-nucleotidase
MAFNLDNRLVIGVASSAMFDLAAADSVFRVEGEAAYRAYQTQHLKVPLDKGIAFSFVRRLLSLNDLSEEPLNNPLVEVVLLSKNDPDTGLRVMNSIAHHKLQITRAIFRGGQSPYAYIPALNISLFLSANTRDVADAINAGLPAGVVMPSTMVDDPEDDTLRIAFDFDGVLADDESETVYHNTQDLKQFNAHETEKVAEPHNPGPLQAFLLRIAAIQALEEQRKLQDKNYKNRIRVAVVTARSAPAHERTINTLKSWKVIINDAFFLGGIDKSKVLAVLRPHIFFDDQTNHLISSSTVAPSVHIPFGIKNVPR